jgi:hypothetical protein
VRKATGHAWHWVFAIELCCAETNSGWISLPKGVKVTACHRLLERKNAGNWQGGMHSYNSPLTRQKNSL